MSASKWDEDGGTSEPVSQGERQGERSGDLQRSVEARRPLGEGFPPPKGRDDSDAPAESPP